MGMSDEEYYEEEEVTSQTSKKGEGFLKAKKQKGELDEQLREYINEWRKQRAKEEEELKRLKEKQAKRKEIRAEQGKKLAQQKKEEEERLRKEEADKKAKEAEEKRKRLEEAEKKRQAMMQAQKEKQQAAGQGAKGPKKTDSGMGNVQDARREMTKTKEQLEEEKKISLSIRIKPLDLDAMDGDQLTNKASELWETIVRLETEKYDLEERQKRQDYDLKELKERQKQQLRQKAMKKGLDPEALTGKYPPKIRMYSKYERRTDTRTYEDRRKLYEGGWEVLYSETLEKDWKDKYENEWAKRSKSKLPKWFGERPGKKAGEPEPPEEDEEEEEKEEGEEEEEKE